MADPDAPSSASYVGGKHKLAACEALPARVWTSDSSASRHGRAPVGSVEEQRGRARDGETHSREVSASQAGRKTSLREKGGWRGATRWDQQALPLKISFGSYIYIYIYIYIFFFFYKMDPLGRE